MKIAINIILLAFSLLIAVCPVVAHDGLIAFFSDQSTSSCHVILPEFQVYRLPLFYIRGDGPRLGNACEFRVAKSSTGMILGAPEFTAGHGLVSTLGSLEGGITISYHAGENWCAPDEDVYLLCYVPVTNLSDTDTFTVSIVPDPTCPVPYCARAIIPCGIWECYSVAGGTFVFNGDCYTPEDPFGSPVGVESSSWGAIKKLFE